MSLSVLGIIMIIATVLVFGYVGIDTISSTISSGVDNGATYDELALLNSEYQSLYADCTKLKSDVYERGDDDEMKALVNVKMELVTAKSAITDVESSLSSGKSSEETYERLKIAKEQLKIAKQKYADLESGKYEKSNKTSNKLDETKYTTA